MFKEEHLALGETLEKLRIRLGEPGESRRRFAKDFGWGRGRVGDIEKGLKPPTVFEFIKWTRDCKRNPAEVFATLLTEQEAQRLEKTKREHADVYNGVRMALDYEHGPMLERIFDSLFGAEKWRLSSRTPESLEQHASPRVARGRERTKAGPKARGGGALS